jgi:hypothetical protein
VLGRRKSYGLAAGNFQGKDVFRVMGDARGVAVAPFGKDFIFLAEMPVPELGYLGGDARFLCYFPECRGDQGFATFLAAGNRLPVAGMGGALKQQESEEKDGERVLRSERYFGKVSRSFQLAQDIDDAQAVAKFNDGVLELTLPKRTAASSKRLSIL